MNSEDGHGVRSATSALVTMENAAAAAALLAQTIRAGDAVLEVRRYDPSKDGDGLAAPRRQRSRGSYTSAEDTLAQLDAMEVERLTAEATLAPVKHISLEVIRAVCHLSLSHRGGLGLPLVWEVVARVFACHKARQADPAWRGGLNTHT
jgi:hypothetical protein